MKSFIAIVVYMCVNTLANSQTYRAATVFANNGITSNSYASVIHEAGRAKVDILVLPTPELSDTENNYDEIIKTVSKATKQAGVYVIAHLFEKAQCQTKMETVRSNLVFDRRGFIVSIYRKPLNKVANCTAVDPDIVIFPTDFGVNFGLLMEEDLVQNNVEYFKGLKNFVMTGAVASEIPFFSAVQFLPSWSYINRANLISSAGIYGGKLNLKTVPSNLVIADFGIDSGLEYPSRVPVANPMKFSSYLTEDLSQYIIKALDVENSTQGYQKIVCHKSFCCEFHIKTSVAGSKPTDVNYGLAAFDGIRHYSGNNNIGAQNCAIFACAGLYNRSCPIGSENNGANIIFEKITISANFTKLKTMQYPAVQATGVLSRDSFKFDSKTHRKFKQVTIEIKDGRDLLAFGIFGRDFTKDYKTEFVTEEINDRVGLTNDIYEFFFSEGVQEFFDYVWIRLRILIFVVSIYFLEMM